MSGLKISLAALLLMSVGAFAQTDIGPVKVTTIDSAGMATAPADPGAGLCRGYFNTVSGFMTWITSSGASCGPTGGGASVGNQYSVQYSSNGTGGFAGTTNPSVNGLYLFTQNVNSGANAPVALLPGVPVDSTSPATLSYTDRASYLRWGSGSTLTLPAASTNFASNFPFVVQNTSGGTLALTPTTPNNIDGGSSQAASNLYNLWASFIYQDSTPEWWTVKFPTYSAFPNTATGQALGFNSATGVFGAVTLPQTAISYNCGGSVTTGLYCGTYSNSGTANNNVVLLTRTGTLENLWCFSETATSTGGSVTATLYAGTATSLSNTGISCTMQSTNNGTCGDTTDTYANPNAGELTTIKVTVTTFSNASVACSVGLQ